MMKTKLFPRFLMATMLMAIMLTGCGPPLSHVKDYSMAVGEIIEVPISAISREQTVRIMAKSQGKPIMVHAYLAEHADATNDAIIMGKPSDYIIAGEDSAEEISLEALVPAGKEVVIRLQPAGATSAEVHLEITN